MSPDRRPALLLLFLLLLSQDRREGVQSLPVCARGPTGCQAVPLSELMDRAVQHSARIHGLSSHLHQQLEQNFLTSRNHIGRANRRCHTSHILTPAGKENVQSLAREELTAVVLELLRAWREPLAQLHRSTARPQDSSVAREMADLVRRLSGGVERMAGKLQDVLSNSLGGPPSAGAPHPPSWSIPPGPPYELLACFRRDLDKVHSFLRILKCRIFPEHGC